MVVSIGACGELEWFQNDLPGGVFAFTNGIGAIFFQLGDGLPEA